MPPSPLSHSPRRRRIRGNEYADSIRPLSRNAVTTVGSDATPDLVNARVSTVLDDSQAERLPAPNSNLKALATSSNVSPKASMNPRTKYLTMSRGCSSSWRWFTRLART